jgi:hypothetical protein
MKTRDRFCRLLLDFAGASGVPILDGYERGEAYRPHRGEARLMGALATILETSPEGAHDNWLTYLPKRVAAAFERMRSEDGHEALHTLRAAYIDDTGYSIPSLINAHEGGIHRVLVCHSVVRLLPIVAATATNTGEKMPWLESALDSYLHAQDRAVEQAWHGFVDRHYTALMTRIKAEQHPGNKGTFGSTELLTWDSAGRVMFQFQRGDEWVTAIADDSDPVGYRSGLNAIAIPYERAVAMIRDVTTNFNNAKLRKSDGVSFMEM